MLQLDVSTTPFPLIPPTELLQRTDQPLLFVFRFSYPELFTVLHDVGQDGTPEEDHVFSSWRIFDSDFEILQKGRKR
jgi:hypothetical protein